MLADEIKNKLNYLALKGMDDWESDRPKQKTTHPELPSGLHRKRSHEKTIQLKLFEK